MRSKAPLRTPPMRSRWARTFRGGATTPPNPPADQITVTDPYGLSIEPVLGTYPRNGDYNGQPAYERPDHAYWTWYSAGTNTYLISTGKGTGLPSYKNLSTGTDPNGTYLGQGGWSFIVTVTKP